MIDLPTILKRAEDATAGPWRADDEEEDCIHAGEDADGIIICFAPELVGNFIKSQANWPANATFIAHARTDVVDLCKEVATLRSDNEAKGKEIEELKVSVEDWKKIGKAHIVHLKEDEFRTRLKGVEEEAAKIAEDQLDKVRDSDHYILGWRNACARISRLLRSRSTDPADAWPSTPSTPSQKDDV